MADMGVLEAASAQIYRYMNFDKIEEYKEGRRTPLRPEVRPACRSPEKARSAVFLIP